MNSIFEESAIPDWDPLDDDPTCPICLEHYSHKHVRLRLDTCQHSLCRECFAELLRAADTKDEERLIRCPFCRKFMNITIKFDNDIFKHLKLRTLPLVFHSDFDTLPDQTFALYRPPSRGFSHALPNSGVFGNVGSRGVQLQDFATVEIRQTGNFTSTMLTREMSVQYCDPLFLEETNIYDHDIEPRLKRLLKLLKRAVPIKKGVGPRKIERVPDLQVVCSSKEKRNIDGSPTWYDVTLSQTFESMRGTSRSGNEVVLARWVTVVNEFCNYGTPKGRTRASMATEPLANWKHLFRAQMEIQRVIAAARRIDHPSNFEWHFDALLTDFGIITSKTRIALDPRKDYLDILYEYGKFTYYLSLAKQRLPGILCKRYTDFVRFKTTRKSPWPAVAKFGAMKGGTAWFKYVEQVIRTSF
ncbi:RING/U-box [Glarea lozoyensis ATCC 20868]|uniref:RING/U-box n=1 Tax=Glarea lozoyensis (strain ATCC 20868 / MF5171) TaxID=1116229 RepID=S3CXH6_GLAL2|nr:RING/U-box [Glarea lozoyensis ATCC 20868]EPE30290.1 RING/U-box [Glarea lozoyensis ATCC 20868]